MSVSVDIRKSFGDFTLDVRFEAGQETLSLLGDSGCGKSMTLRCIAGVIRPDEGVITINGRTVFDSSRKINLKPQQRRVGYLFQNYALFPNMTIVENIMAGLERRKDINKKERRELAMRYVDQFKLGGMEDRYPSEISGGQQQRTALARILVSDPQILLLDEPFSALDSHLRFRMEQEVREVIQSFGKTVILVSHDRDEVFRLSDKIAVMDQGNVDVFGTKHEVFADPQTRNACILTGCKNISPIRKLDDYHLVATDWNMELETARPIGDASYIGIRHHDTNGEGEVNTYLCDVDNVIENPFSYTVLLRLASQPGSAAFGWELDKQLWHKVQSEQIEIHVPPESILLLKE